VLGYETYAARLGAGYRLCYQQRRGKRRHPPLGCRGVLEQEEHQTIRPRLGPIIMRVMVSVLRVMVSVLRR
jgi:hypothetical protein